MRRRDWNGTGAPFTQAVPTHPAVVRWEPWADEIKKTRVRLEKGAGSPKMTSVQTVRLLPMVTSWGACRLY